jgi:hypothetical protein
VTVLSDDTLLATRNAEAVWRSQDQGETWTLAGEGLEDSLTGIGGPRDNIFFRHLVQERSGRVLLSTWSGLYASQDSGLIWTAVETEMPWVTRSIDMASGSDGNAWVLVGKYGGGIARIRADGTEASSVGADIRVRFVRSVSLGAGSGEAQAMLVTDFGSVNASADGGETWTTCRGLDWEELSNVDIEDDSSDGPVALLAGSIFGGAYFARSADGGETWDPAEAPQACFEGRRVLDLPPDWDAQPEAWAGCRTDAVVFVSHDRGESWDDLGPLVPPWLTQIKGLPGESAALTATTEGLYKVSADGTVDLVAFDGEQVSSVAVSRGWQNDGTAFVVVAGMGWYRTQDWGESWQELPRPTLSHAEILEVSPDFPNDSSLAVGTYDGAWASQDAGESWTYVAGVDRLEEDHGLWDFGPGWSASIHQDYSGTGLMTAVAEGLTAELVFRGSAFDLIGSTSTDGGVLSIRLDGGPEVWVDFSGNDADQIVLYRSSDLESGLHTLAV